MSDRTKTCATHPHVTHLVSEACPFCEATKAALRGKAVPEPTALDVQVGGDHYKKMKIQPMEYSMANNLNACQHTIVKYVTRYKAKGGIEDLKKARHTLDMLIEFEEAERERVKAAIEENLKMPIGPYDSPLQGVAL